MFQPETEDMLPRAAPMPSANLGSNHAGIQPMVPEISILYGQLGAGESKSAGAAATHMPAYAKQTYAAWKKKVLPKVNYPTDLMASNSETTPPASGNHSPTAEYAAAPPRSNLYPLRTATAAVSPLAITTTTSSSVESLQYQRRSAEITPPIYAAHDYGFQQHRRSLDTVTQRTYTPSRDDVLTICAGTQTEAVAGASSPDTATQSPHKFASKQDVEQLLGMLREMRAEQLRLTQFCEALLVRQRDDDDLPKKTFLRDIGTQYDIAAPNLIGTAAARRPIMHDYIDEEEVAVVQRQPLQQQPAAPPPNAYHNQLLQQVQRTTPVAQSTAYRANTPRQLRPVFVAQHQQQMQQQNAAKPITEQSMVMNELALKYLPNEKLDELLQELHMSPRSTANGGQAVEAGAAAAQQQQQQQISTPLRPVENFEKCPNDISNASYKYLKKYRLLPEENGAAYQQTSPRMQSPVALVRQQQQSPYQQQFAGSPLNMGGGDGRVQEQLLDLDQLRKQPKFV